MYFRKDYSKPHKRMVLHAHAPCSEPMGDISNYLFLRNLEAVSQCRASACVFDIDIQMKPICHLSMKWS